MHSPGRELELVEHKIIPTGCVGYSPDRYYVCFSPVCVVCLLQTGHIFFGNQPPDLQVRLLAFPVQDGCGRSLYGGMIPIGFIYDQ